MPRARGLQLVCPFRVGAPSIAIRKAESELLASSQGSFLAHAMPATEARKPARASQIPRVAGICRRRVSSLSCLWVTFRSGCHARGYTRATTAHPMESRRNWNPVAISIPSEGVSLIPVAIFFREYAAPPDGSKTGPPRFNDHAPRAASLPPNRRLLCSQEFGRGADLCWRRRSVGSVSMDRCARLRLRVSFGRYGECPACCRLPAHP